MRDHKNSRIGGKGYYIALVLCAAAIGTAGYVYRNNHKQVKQVSLVETQPVLEYASQPESTVSPTETQKPPQKAATAPTAPAATQKPAPKGLVTAPPVEGDQAVLYSMDALSFNETTRDWRVHNGVDYTAQEGTQVKAAAEGTVVSLQDDGLMGLTLVLRHTGGYETTYAGLETAETFSPGDRVDLGETLGTVGTTALAETALGPHVHFSVTYQDMPMDPADFLNLGN